LIQICEGNFLSGEKDIVKPDIQYNTTTSDGGRTSGRWTNEEHHKFIEALKKYGKQWKKVEDHIQTRSGAQIRSHAQKYFLKIQKEYPDQDSFEVFKNKTPEFLEETIFMKKKGESDDGMSSNSKSIARPQTPPKYIHALEGRDDHNMDFAKSVTDMLARKRVPQVEIQQPPVPNFQETQENNDLLAIKSFFEHIQSSLSGSFVRNQGGARYATSEGNY
jgi:SHAQKYF class myb-like DNA-binding protein